MVPYDWVAAKLVMIMKTRNLERAAQALAPREHE